MLNVYKIKFKIQGDERGNLIALEAFKEIPFEMKRVYYIFGTQAGVRRGLHAHKKLSQVMICVSGSCKLILDNGYEREMVELNSSDEGLLILNEVVWREMFDFSPDCVLMVIASDFYDEKDYIRDYHEFKEYIGNKALDDL